MSHFAEGLVPLKGSDKLFKTLDLLRLETTVGTLWFVVEGVADPTDTAEEIRSHKEYFYDEHSCPTNYVRVEMISIDGDTDPHGLFDFVEFAWMTTDYAAAPHGWLLRRWPQLERSPDQTSGAD